PAWKRHRTTVARRVGGWFVNARPGRRVAVAAVLAAAVCWATTAPMLALFLRDESVDGVTLALLRAGTAAMVLWLWLGIRRPSALRIDRSALPGLIGYGLWSITFFYLAVSFGVAGTSASVAITLLYLAPSLVTAGGAIWLGETLSGVKLTALAMSLIGIALVVRLNDPGNLAGTPSGIGWILLAAVAYAGYSLLGKRMLGRYAPETIIAWYLLFGTIGLIVVKLLTTPGDWPEPRHLASMALLLGLLTTLLPTSLYLFALTGLPSSEASIITAIEPVITVAIAAVLLDERLEPIQVLGSALVLASVVLVNAGGLPRATQKSDSSRSS
ncbi:MAG: DMT family transporter, partial [Thermomicrobiales bacterium]